MNPQDKQRDEIEELLKREIIADIHTFGDAITEIQALITQQQHLLLDRVEQSINNHTVSEGKHLLSRSYVRNTIKFERNAIKEGLK